MSRLRFQSPPTDAGDAMSEPPPCKYCALGYVVMFGFHGSTNPQAAHLVQHETYSKYEPCTNPKVGRWDWKTGEIIPGIPMWQEDL
jgi:hypothetical protein